MSRRWKECLLKCDKEDVVVWIGAWPSEKKAYKYPNLDPKKCYYIDPLYEESKVSENGINLFSVAISDREGKEEMFVSKSTQNTSLYRNHAENIENVKTVKAMTLDAFYDKCRLEKVHFLHVNAEGAEFKIINSPTKHWLDKTENVWLEFHKFLEDDWKTQMLVFKKLLKEKGFFVKIWDSGTYEVMTATKNKHYGKNGETNGN